LPFQLAPLPQITIHPASFIRKFQFGKGIDERGYVGQIVRRANNDQCRIHVLLDDVRYYGFAAISLSEFNRKPAIVLEYLFASHDQRGIRHEDLGDLTAGEYLLQYCLEQARVINDLIPISYFTLEPADDRLIQYYLDKDFELVANTGWMFLSI